jgi:hypothetical protein
MGKSMAEDSDDRFFERADAHITLSNEQAKEESRGKVSASMMYATARFNAWVGASNCATGEELASARDEAIEYFVEQYRTMLTENLDAYIQNFDQYMVPVKE